MLRIRPYVGPMITLDMRTVQAEADSIKAYRDVKATGLRGKKMNFRHVGGETLVEIDNIKTIESIRPASVSDIIIGRL